jgi:hypothetical protein
MGASKTAFDGQRRAGLAARVELLLGEPDVGARRAQVEGRSNRCRHAGGGPFEGRPRCRADDAVGRQAAGALELADAPGRGRAEATIGRDGTAGGECLAELVLHLLDRRPMAALAKGRVGGSRVRRGVGRFFVGVVGARGVTLALEHQSGGPGIAGRALHVLQEGCAEGRPLRVEVGAQRAGQRAGPCALVAVAGLTWQARTPQPSTRRPASGRLDRGATLHRPSVRRVAGHSIGSAGPESLPDRARSRWAAPPRLDLPIPPATSVREARIGRHAWRPPMPLRLRA